MERNINTLIKIINMKFHINNLIPFFITVIVICSGCKTPVKELSLFEKNTFQEFETKYNCKVRREFETNFVLNKKDSTNCFLEISFNKKGYNKTAFIAMDTVIHKLYDEYKFKVYQFIIAYAVKADSNSYKYFKIDTLLPISGFHKK